MCGRARTRQTFRFPLRIWLARFCSTGRGLAVLAGPTAASGCWGARWCRLSCGPSLWFAGFSSTLYRVGCLYPCTRVGEGEATHCVFCAGLVRACGARVATASCVSMRAAPGVRVVNWVLEVRASDEGGIPVRVVGRFKVKTDTIT